MSKKLWLPPIKFGEGATPIRPLPKVRIKGVEDRSILAQQLLGMFTGQIGQFHMAAAQNYHLAPQPIYLAKRDLPDIKLRYTNMYGQEIIDVAVNPAIIEQLLAPSPKTPWDWLLIDLDFIPPTYTSQLFGDDDVATGHFKAVLRFPSTQGVTEARNRFIDDPRYASAETPPILQYAGSSHYSTIDSLTGQPVRQISSLIVDIRRFPTDEEIIIDLWGGLDGFAEDLIEVETLTGSTFAGFVEHNNEHNEHFLHFRSGYSLEDVLEIYPEFAAYFLWTSNMSYDPLFDYDSMIDNFGPASTTHSLWGARDVPSTGFTAQETYPLYTYLDEATALPIEGGTTFRGRHRWREFRYLNDSATYVYNSAPPVLPPERTYGHYDRDFFHMPVYEFDLVEFQPPADAVATMRAIAFKGTPSWRSSLHRVHDPWLNRYYLWEFADLYPDRHEVPIINSSVALSDNSTANNPSYLGSVHFLQKDGAFVFKPA